VALHYQWLIIINGSSSITLYQWSIIIAKESSSMGLPNQWGFLFLIGGLASMALYHQWGIIIDGASFLFDVYIIDEISWSTVLNH
jgi:hypothetical protein